MQRGLLAPLVIGAFIAATTMGIYQTAAQGACEFRLGFATLRDMIVSQYGEIVGPCLENENFEPSTGNALQRTGGGLMVWRKADNWTAFTDGNRTFLNGPDGLAVRPNAGPLFGWEAPVPAPPPQPSPLPPPPAPAPSQPGPVSAPAPQSGSGNTVIANPTDILLRLEDMGKEIKQLSPKSGSDSRVTWAEVRYERESRRLESGLGPIYVANLAYVTRDVDAAQWIYKEEVARQSKMPEANARVGGIYAPDREEIGVVPGDALDVLAACNVSCSSKDFNAVHMRAVLRYRNAVAVLYFYGGRDSATPAQMNQWLSRNRERMFE